MYSALKSLQGTHEMADKVIDWLVKFGLMSRPLGFAVGWEYLSGDNNELVHAINQFLATDQLPDEHILFEWHEKYVSQSQFNDLDHAGVDLTGMLLKLMQNLTEAGAGADAYRKTLSTQILRFGQGVSAESIEHIVHELMMATQQAQAQNQELHHCLVETYQESERLRTELEQRRQEVMVDPLTGLLNRRAYEIQMAELVEKRGMKPLSMLVGDIDHFKSVNDTYGHAVGDIVLKNIAALIRKSVRGGDVAVRFGGEEFVVLLPDTDIDGAERVAESIRHQVEVMRLVRRQDQLTLGPFTLSFGIATWFDADTIDSLFERADKAMYHAKQTGRNRVSRESVVV